MKIRNKLFVLLLVFISLWAILIKLYFAPKTRLLIDLAIQNEMKKDTRSLEQIIATVAYAARGDKDVVRKALFEISRNPEIPVTLLRSDAIQKQYGRFETKSFTTEPEKRAAFSGKPVFLSDKDSFQYIYPLKAQSVCQGCHELDGEKIPIGYVLGLAVRKSSRQEFLDSGLSFFVLDLFWENLALLAGSLLILSITIIIWFFRPFEKLAKRAEGLLLINDDVEKIHYANEESILNQYFDETEKK